MMKRRLSLNITCGVIGVLLACLVAWVQQTHAQTASPLVNRQIPAVQYLPDTPANRELHQAIEDGDLAKVQAALAAGGSPEARYSPGGTRGAYPLVILAAYKSSNEAQRYLPIFRLLADHVQDVNLREPFQQETLLLAAADMGDLGIVRSLIQRGAQVNATSPVNPNGFGHGFTGGEDALCKAVARTGIRGPDPDPIVSYLLANGAEATRVYADGSTALMRAAQYHKINTVRLLLQKGADPNQRDAHDFTALRWAMARGDDAVAAILRPLTKMNLWEAAENGNAARIKELLAAGADPNGLRLAERLLATAGAPSTGPLGETPLMAAMRSNDAATVKVLLDAGANPRLEDRRSGGTALHIAAAYGSTAVIPLLLHAGADIDVAAVRRDNIGQPRPYAVQTALTPLLTAVNASQADTVALLLYSGVHVAAHDQGDRALVEVIQNAGRDPRRPIGQSSGRAVKGEANLAAQYRIFQLLLKAGASPDRSGALAVTVSANQSGLMEELLARGASPNAHYKDSSGDTTPLLAAIDGIGGDRSELEDLHNGTESGPNIADVLDRERGHRACLEALLKHGANVNEFSCDKGQTPFMAAIEAGDYAIARDLLRRGAKREATDAAGRTALLRAVAGNDIAAVTWLLNNGANQHARDRNGYTALMLAIDAGDNDDWAQLHVEAGQSMGERPNPDGHPALVKFLLAHGADRKVVAADHQTTALTLARKNGFHALEALL